MAEPKQESPSLPNRPDHSSIHADEHGASKDDDCVDARVESSGSGGVRGENSRELCDSRWLWPCSVGFSEARERAVAVARDGCWLSGDYVGHADAVRAGAQPC